MNAKSINGRLDVYKPSNTDTEPNFTIPNEDIAYVEISERIQDLNDTADIILHNVRGEYTGKITAGDMVQFYITRTDRSDAFGDGLFGDGLYNGAQMLVWTGLVGNIDNEKFSPVLGEISLECQDFVGGVLSYRVVYNSYEDKQISGTETSVVNRLVERNAPEVGRGKIETVQQTTDLFENGGNLFDVLGDISREANCLMASKGTDLIFKPIESLSSTETITEGDVEYPIKHRKNDDNLTNWIRIDGSLGREEEVSYTTVDDYQTVTEGDPITLNIRTRKTRLHSIDVWTRKTGSGDGVIVRIQSDDGGQPVDIGNENSDLVRVQINEDDDEFIDDGFTRFVLSDHTLPEPNSWLIIDGDGEDGQEIGINSADGTPAIRTYFPFPVSTVRPDHASQQEYRLRESSRTNESLMTFNSARGLGDAVIERNKLPRKGFEFVPVKNEHITFSPLDAITLDIPDVGAVGDHVITEKTTTYEEADVDVSYTTQEIASL